MNTLIDIHKPVTICRASAGTGKTYTLAAYYVGLLLSGEDYRSILAITFTNKATAEMSERIIGYLHGIAEGGESAFLEYARSFMVRDAGAPESLLRARAGECFRKMLLDYDNVQVQTIDSFLQSLLSGLAGVLRVGAGQSTELDVEHVIRTAVDELLSTEMTAADKEILEDYMLLKLDQESQWDVRGSLVAMVKELYNESVQMLDAEGKILFDAKAIQRRREQVEQLWQNDERVKELKAVLDTCKMQYEGYNRYSKAAYERLSRSVEKPEKVSAKDRFRGVTGKFCSTEEMAQATAIAEDLAKTYNTLFLTVKFSRDQELMASLQAIILRDLAEANSALLARTASTLSKALKTGDADFILEKAGIRYKHVLIDEFQDTSRLQWSVIEQLLRDVLAGAGNTLLIVGDIKQSIYRWRNGDWHIMEELKDEGRQVRGKGSINERFTSLTRNFRSSEEVVKFNLALFDYITNDELRITNDELRITNDELRITNDELGKLAERIYGEGYKPENLEHFYQADKKRGGYVRFKAFPNAKDDELAADMFEQMEALLQKGVRAEDMMVLVRFRSEAVAITDMKAELDEAQFPLLTKTAVVSADSFQLDASADVQLIIAALRYLVHGDEVAGRMVNNDELKITNDELKINAKTPLYEAVSELVRVLLTDEKGQYKGTETAYLNSLLDRTREYVGAYGSSIEDFLVYWDDTMHAKPIPVTAANAIQIMTVHASKGLQAQTLFVPFCHWEQEDGRHKPKVWCEVSRRIDERGDYVPVLYGSEMADSDYAAEYAEEQTNLRIDNLNMLYVALTRAEDNLFVNTSYSVTKDGKRGACNHVGKYLLDFAGEEGYEAGEVKIKNYELKITNDELMAELWANSDHVRFVQSQEGALYTDYGDEAYRRVARMDEGTLCHEIFAHIRKADELEAVLDDFETRGEIDSKEKREELRNLISSAWEGSPKMRDWFTKPWELRLEEAIYTDHRELRPDRVMINPETNEAVVLDYKFGGWDDHYLTQVREYMEALRRMGHSPVRGYLWFARKNELREVHG